MADELGFDIVAHDDSSRAFDAIARKAQETALKVEAANLKVERAAGKAAAAEEKYGKESLQARDASNKLSTAQLGLSKAMESTSKSVEDTKTKVEKLDVVNRKSDDSSNRLSATMRGLATRVGSVAASMAPAVANVAGLGSVAVTAGIGVAKLAIATAHFAAAVGPAAAGLLPLAAGFLFVKATVVGAGPEMARALEPVTNAWNKQLEAVGKLSSAGLRPLAQDFVKVNFPQIRKAMDTIASATNGVVKGFISWANSAPGVKAIGEITKGAADTFKRLAPIVGKVVQSLAELGGRAAGSTFKNFGDAAQTALIRLNEFISNITSAQVSQAFAKIKSAGETAGKGIQALGKAMEWAGQHTKEIYEIRTAVALLGIALGIATGGILPALGGAITLVVMNWSKLTAGFKAASGWFDSLGQRLPSLTGPAQAAAGAFDQIKSAASDFAKAVGPHLQPFMDRLKDAFIKLQPTIVGLVAVVGVLAAAWLRIAGPIVGGLLDGLGLLIDGFADVVRFATFAAIKTLDAFAGILKPIADVAVKLHLPFAHALSQLVTDSHNAAARMQASFDATNVDVATHQIDVLQRKVNTLKGKKIKTEADKKAIADGIREIARLQAARDKLTGKTIYITAYTSNIVRSKSGSTAPGAHAAGGPIRGPGTSTSDSIPAMLSNGENVFSAADVARLGGQAAVERLKTGRFAGMSQVRAGGGGSAVVSIEIDSGGSQMDDLLVAIMRKAVRVKGGGNVQVALGRT